MAASTFSDDDEGVISDINVTPLVDVVLVLLIVFLITVPAIVASAPIKVDLPKSTSVKLASEMPSWIISVRRETTGELGVYLNERKIDEASLVVTIKKLGLPPAEQSVTLAADQMIPYGEVIKVLDMLHRVGLQKVAVDTKHVE